MNPWSAFFMGLVLGVVSTFFTIIHTAKKMDSKEKKQAIAIAKEKNKPSK